MPVQRIPRYRLLLEELLKATPSEHQDASDTEAALKLVTDVASRINETKNDADRVSRLVDIQKSIIGGSSKVLIVEAHRKYIREGEFEVRRSRGS